VLPGRIRTLFESEEAFLADRKIQTTLKLWAKKARLCNMHIERLFALIRQSFAQKVPSLERLVSAGLLSQVLGIHLQHGGVHPDSMSRRSLIEAGCPIAAAADVPEAMPTRARGHLAFLAEHVRNASRKKGGALTLREQADIRKEGMELWRDFLPAEREAWSSKAARQVNQLFGKYVRRLCIESDFQ